MTRATVYNFQKRTPDMNPKALVVDNEKIFRNLLEAIVRNLGFDVTTAGDGSLAEKALRSGDFDLVITDLEMGNTNGFKVIQLAKSINSSSIVLVATGCLDERCRSQALALGASDYLLKPFSLADLENRLVKQFTDLQKQPNNYWKDNSKLKCQKVLHYVKQPVCRQELREFKSEQKVIG